MSVGRCYQDWDLFLWPEKIVHPISRHTSFRQQRLPKKDIIFVISNPWKFHWIDSTVNFDILTLFNYFSAHKSARKCSHWPTLIPTRTQILMDTMILCRSVHTVYRRTPTLIPIGIYWTYFIGIGFGQYECTITYKREIQTLCSCKISSTLSKFMPSYLGLACSSAFFSQSVTTRHVARNWTRCSLALLK